MHICKENRYYGTPAYNAWRGLAFETVCLCHLRQIDRALSLSTMDTRKFPWTSTSSSPGAQIDLVIERPDKIVHLCETKCTNDPFCVTADVAKELRRKATVFKEETGTKSSAQIVIVASAGVKPGAHADVAVRVVIGDDLFA